MNPESPVNSVPDAPTPNPGVAAPPPIPPPAPSPTVGNPDAPRGWNWGAFFFSWIWGIFNKVWISLLAFVPGVGIIMPFVLGFKGTEWAWKASGGTKTVDEFRTNQHRWAVAGFTVLVVVLVLGAGSSLLVVAFQSTAGVGAQATAENFMADVQKDDATDAYQLTSTTFQAGTNSADFTTAVDTLAPNLTGSLSLTVLEAVHADDTDGHTAVSYQLIDGQHEVVLKLSQAPHGKWLIDTWYPDLTPSVPSS